MPVASLGTAESVTDELSSSLLPPIRYLYTLIRSSWPFSRINNCMYLSLCSYTIRFKTFITEATNMIPRGCGMSTSLTLRIPGLDPALQLWPHQCCVEGADHIPQPAGNVLSHAAPNDVGQICHRAHCWLMFNASFTRNCLFSFAKLLSSWPPVCIAWSIPP